MVAYAPAPLPAPAPGPAARMLCARCGVVAPLRATHCASCAQPLVRAAPPAVSATAPAIQGPDGVPVPADPYWVALRCGFQCRSCSFLAPLDHLDVDGTVECIHCGLRQRFDVESWREALAFAQDVGDLAGPAPEGRRPHPVVWVGSDNPHRDLGLGTTFGELTLGGTHAVDGLMLPRSLQVEGAPGHPSCRTCHVPLVITVPQIGRAETRCGRCGERAVYATPDEARALAPALLALVADEHRTDQPRATQATTEGGAQALRCPGCGAPLQVQGHDRVVGCPFCKTSCLIPARALLRDGEDRPKPALWWALFTGPSAQRTALEAPVQEAAATAVGAVSLLKPGGRRVAEVGDQPGVYEAPEVDGIHWLQLGVTLALGTLALLVGYLVTGP